MIKRKLGYIVSCSLLLLLSLGLFSVPTCYAQDEVRMSIEQFKNLRKTTKELQEQQRQQIKDSQMLKTQLKDSQDALRETRIYLNSYQSNLKKLQEQTDLLNKDLKRAKTERNLAIVLLLGGIVAGVTR